MYYFMVVKNSIYFVDIYAKNDKENITANDRKILHQLVEEIKKTEV